MQVKRGELVRIYLVNALEFDLAELVPRTRQLLRLLPDRHEARAARLHGHGDPGAGRARHPRAALPVHRQVHVPRPRERVRGARLDGLLRGGGLMEAATAAVRRPLWLTGLIPVVVLAVAIGLFVALDAPGLDRIGVPQEELAIERTVLQAGRDPAARAQRRRGPRAGAAGDRQRRVRGVHPDARTRSAGSAGPRSTSTTRGSRARTTRSRCSPPPARRSTTTIEAAVETPDADLGFYGLMALIGLYVGRDPGRDRDALAAVDARRRRALDWLPARVHGRTARLPRRRGAAGGHRPRRRRAPRPSAGPRWSGSARRAPTSRWPASTRGCATRRAAPAAGAARASLGDRAAFLVALGIGLHNLGEGLAIGSAYAVGLARARRRAGGRLRASQHDGGARDRRAGRARSGRRTSAASCCSACSPGAPGGAGRVDRRLGLQPEPRGAHVRQSAPGRSPR